MDVMERVDALIRPSLEDMGYDLVRVHFTGGGRPVLQIMCERTDGSMNLDDCAEVSRAISALLDVEDPVPEAYELEVSSPGVDRPLTRLRDFDRYAGHEAKVELAEPVQGRKRYRGIVKGIDGDDVVLAVVDGDVALPFSQIKAAKLVLTDALLAAHAATAPQDGGRSAGNGAGSGQE
ncbi:MAG: ribosome maturation factor RimP [Sneathiellaceae bacterium]